METRRWIEVVGYKQRPIRCRSGQGKKKYPYPGDKSQTVFFEGKRFCLFFVLSRNSQRQKCSQFIFRRSFLGPLARLGSKHPVSAPSCKSLSRFEKAKEELYEEYRIVSFRTIYVVVYHRCGCKNWSEFTDEILSSRRFGTIKAIFKTIQTV